VGVQRAPETNELWVGDFGVPGDSFYDAPHRPGAETVVATASVAMRNENPSPRIPGSTRSDIRRNRLPGSCIQENRPLTIPLAAHIRLAGLSTRKHFGGFEDGDFPRAATPSSRGWDAGRQRPASFLSSSCRVSDDAMKEMGRELRSWRLNCRSDKSLDDFAHMFNKVVQGWINYYGRFYTSELVPMLRRINTYLVQWAKRKYNDCVGIPRGRNASWWASLDANQPCSHTGGLCGQTAGQWELGDSRG